MTKPRTWTEWRIDRGNSNGPTNEGFETQNAAKTECITYLNDEVIQVRVTEILPDEVERAERVIKYCAGFEVDKSRESVGHDGCDTHNIWLHGYYSITDIEAMLTLLRAANADI